MPAIPTSPLYFYPEQNSTLAVTATTARVALGSVGDTVIVYNDGGNNAFIAFGDATITATAGGTATASSDGSMCIPPGAVMTYRIDPSLVQTGPVNVAGICAGAGTTTLRITRGSGV